MEGRINISIFSLAILLSISKVQAQQPNIVLFFSDDHTQRAIGAYQALDPYATFGDYAGLETPNIDRLASDGVVFSNSFVSNSICAPSRANLLTGLHSHANGKKTNVGSTFDGGQQTFPKLLQTAGYDTALIGKWHLYSEPTGFNHYERLIGQGNYYKPVLRTTQPGGGTSDVVYTGGYIAEVITDRAINWLENKRDTSRPFFIMVNHKATHAC